MKKIIRGKRYDTEKATQCGEYEYSYKTDFRWVHETLYRKRTGEYFLHGEGGPLSKYAKSIGQGKWSGGETIIPLTIDAAKEWAERYLDGDEYEKIFGDASDEGPEKHIMSLSVDEATYQTIKDMAAEWGCSMSAVVTSIVKDK